MFLWRYIVLIFLTLSHFVVESLNKECAATSEASKDISYRLNNTTEPIAYELWLETKINEGILDYEGRIRIALRALEASKSITVHSEQLVIEDYRLFDHLNNTLKIACHEEFKDQTIFAFSLEDSMRIGQNYVLDIEFRGVLQNNGRGFCYTRYINDDGELFYTATSLLHVTNARVAFPCYDEPRYRTPFIIHIKHHQSLKAASNMPVASITNNSDGTAITSFQESVAMPVNVVAFTVCNYESRKIYVEEKNLEISFLIPKDLINEIEFALDFIKFMLNRLEEYLGIGYNLPKIESVVINDLMNTGVENWGLMVYDSKWFLYNENSTTTSQKMDIARTICHLLTHNYFGNIVGISWWSYAWMIEGFAYYYEYHFSNFYFADFPLEEIFVTDLMQRYLADNSRVISKSLSKYAETRKEVEDLFDFAMLTKAAAVVRMCDHTIGKITFQKGLRKYVRDMSFQVAQPEDLHKSIQAAVDEDKTLPEDIKIADFLSSWTDQPGYPLLTVMRNYQSNEIVVNQQRFLSSRDERDPENLSWYIPLSMSTANNPNMQNTKPLVWLKRGMRELVIRTTENQTWTSDDWVLFNMDQTGYYRVNYDRDNWKLLADELHRGSPYSIGMLNRAQLIDDAFNLAYSDIIQFTVALDLIKYLKYEKEYAVWITANRHLLNMIRKLEGPSYELYFGRFLQHLTEDKFARLDVFENTNGKDSIKDIFLRPIIVDLACRSGSGMCLIATRTMVTAEALTGHILVPHENPSVYYCHGLKNADENTFQYFWRKLKTLTNEQERTHIVNSISCYHNSVSVYALLLETADPNYSSVYSNLERFQIIIRATRNGHVKTILKFFRENHESIARLYTFNVRMEQALKEIAECLDEEDQEEFTAILDILLKAGHINSDLLELCKFEMEYHRKWVKENKNKIEEWIAEYFRPAQLNAAKKHFIYLPLYLISFARVFYP